MGKIKRAIAREWNFQITRSEIHSKLLCEVRNIYRNLDCFQAQIIGKTPLGFTFDYRNLDPVNESETNQYWDFFISALDL